MVAILNKKYRFIGALLKVHYVICTFSPINLYCADKIGPKEQCSLSEEWGIDNDLLVKTSA